MFTAPRIQNHLSASELFTLRQVRELGLNERSVYARAADGRIAVAFIDGRAFYSRRDVEVEVSILNALRPKRGEAGWFGPHDTPNPNSRFRGRTRRHVPAVRPQQVHGSSPAMVAGEASTNP